MKIRICKSYGFTLIELIITIAIMAIILTIAYPYIMMLLANMEAKRIRYAIVNTLQLAKAESYIRKKDLIVCLSNDGISCHRDSNKKLLLFIDENKNNDFDLDIDYLLEERALNPKYSTLYLRVGNNRHYTKFWGDSGTPRGHFGHIKYCPTSSYNQNSYQLSFNQGGIIKYKPDSKSQPTECPA